MIRCVAQASCILTLAVGLAACSSPSGPVAPSTVGSPETAVVIHPELAKYIKVPAKPEPVQGYTWTPDNLLQYNYELQNTSDRRFALLLKATFTDDTGFPVDEQMGRRIFLNAYEIKPDKVICANTRGKKVVVQVRPAD